MGDGAVALERRVADTEKRAEREITDAVHKLEREGADGAVARERRDYESERQELRTQREYTDEQLSTERSGADINVAALREAESALSRLRDTDREDRDRAARALRESELQLRQSQRMEIVGELAGGVAHDVNNVLAVIFTMSDLLRAQLEPGSPIRTDVDTIHDAAKRAVRLIRQLLTFTGAQAGESQLVDLNDVLGAMNKMLPCVAGADVELVVRTERPLARVLADPSSIEQVVMNLVVNARDAMPAGGTLTIATSNVLAHADDDLGGAEVSRGPHVLLAVSDTGVGIEEATLERVFEPFFTTKARGKGTGLGLSIVSGIVKRCGGSISVSSKLDEGTTFKVLFPRATEATENE